MTIRMTIHRVKWNRSRIHRFRCPLCRRLTIDRVAHLVAVHSFAWPGSWTASPDDA